MKKKFRDTTVEFKIMMFNICIICVIGMIFSITSYVTANKKAVQLAQNSVKYHVESISKYYEEVYSQMINLVLNCAQREVFDLQSLGKLNTPEEKRKGLEYVRLATNFCAVTGYSEYISKLSIFDESDIHISAGTALSSVDDGKRIKNTNWFDAELEKDMYNYKLNLVTSPFYREKGNIIPIVSENSGYNKKDWTALFLSPNFYLDRIKADDNGNEVLVTTYKGEEIASYRSKKETIKETEKLIDDIIQNESTSGLMNRQMYGQDCMIVYQKETRSGIAVIEIMEMAVLKNDRLMLLQTVFLIFGACAILGVTMSFLFGNAVKKPIDRLVSHVGKIAGGDFSPDYTVEREDEIGLIGKAVNSMSSQIEQLMHKRLEDEKEKSSLELKMLQAQINPHFLYNTLDSIKWIAVIQKNSGIVKAVTSLSKLLKNMAKGVNEQITLREELEFVNDYVTIEKLKYAEMFDLNIQVEDETFYDAKIVKLTLQPLVENAIFSGIEPGGKSGNIVIRVFSEDQCLVIAVRDDGIGIPKEKIPQLLNHSEKLKGDRMSSIGMPNVDRRIKLIYGEEYGLSVESQVGVYTQVVVRIPLQY